MQMQIYESTCGNSRIAMQSRFIQQQLKNVFTVYTGSRIDREHVPRAVLICLPSEVTFDAVDAQDGGRCKHEDRNAQFAHITKTVADHQAAEEPVISINTRKKELIGDLTSSA